MTEVIKPYNKLYNLGIAKDSYPDDNPKTAIGVTKAPYHLVPPAAIHHTAMAFADGAKKYGPYNWREKRVSSSVYYGAAMRHMTAWWDGEDLSQDAQVHHLGHVMACCAIILDGMGIDMLNDDRPAKGAAAALQAVYGKKDKTKEFNDGSNQQGCGVPTDAVPASDREEPVLKVARRFEAEGDLGRDSRSLRRECGCTGLADCGECRVPLY